MTSRICFISLSAYGYFNEDTPAGGGAQRQFYFLGRNLTDSFDVHFVVGDYGQDAVEHREGVTLHSAYTPNARTSVADRLGQLRALWRALDRAKADLYVARCSPRKLTILAPLLRSLGRPLVFHVAADWFVEASPPNLGTARRWIYRRALKNCRTVVTQTPYQAEQLHQHWGIDAPFVPNGYPPARRVDSHRYREHFLWVGRLDQVLKRPHLFLDVAAQFSDEQFLLIGPGRDDHYTESLIERASSMANVRYLGPVAPSEIHDYYRRAIAVLNTASVEGFPNTFLEAWRYATPIVSLDVDTGRFLPQANGSPGYALGDRSTLVSLVDRLADEPSFRRDLGAIGARAFEEHYQLEPIVDAYRDLLHDAIAESL